MTGNGDLIGQRFHEAHVESLNIVFQALSRVLKNEMALPERLLFLQAIHRTVAEQLPSDSEVPSDAEQLLLLMFQALADEVSSE